MAFKLSSELVGVAKGSGDAICKKEVVRQYAKKKRLIELHRNTLKPRVQLLYQKIDLKLRHPHPQLQIYLFTRASCIT